MANKRNQAAVAPRISATHDSAATIERNFFKYKSLSCWSLNLFMGCAHGCRFCYVTDTSVNKQEKLLGAYGVGDPVKDWGSYVLVRPWDEREFMSSLSSAKDANPGTLNADGNRAVFLCSTTDPYQTITHNVQARQVVLQDLARSVRRRALVAIRDHSDLNVRILTRSVLAREDFDIFQSFDDDRLMLGTSLPTLDPVLSRVYESNVQAPRHRLKLLLDAHAAGIPTFVAVAPVFPEVGYQGMLEVFNAVREANPLTIFMEPVNIRLGIAERIQREARRRKRTIDMTPYTDTAAWADYAISTLREAERAAEDAGVKDILHLWPDHEALGSSAVVKRQPDPEVYLAWLQSYWNRISEWPVKTKRK